MCKCTHKLMSFFPSCTCMRVCMRVCIHTSAYNYNFREPTSCWSTNLEDVYVVPFVQRVGAAVTFSASPVEIFRLFFTTTLLATIVEETNRYAREVLGDSAEAKWVDVVAEDIWAFLGFALLMRINRLPQLHRRCITISP